MKKRLIVSVVVAVGLLIVSVPMTAHHSSFAFDTDTELSLKGTVTEWIWSNPHCLLRFDVRGEDGQVISWIAETQNPRNMSNRGWASTSFRLGDQITATVNPAENGRPLGRLLRVALPSGQTLGQTVR